ncbi:MAG: DUF1778 domain-containing protein [Actinomycetota bacterium]|nr:DUF1778 domain-containing protein [Actinomycetota bacterium]
MAGWQQHLPVFEFRVRPDRKSLIERAAELMHEPVSEFARAAAEEKADRVIREYEATTTVPAGFFDDLIDALDAPARRGVGAVAG